MRAVEPSTILEILEQAAGRYGDRHVLGTRHDDGTTTHWSYRTLLRRSRAAAWRLRTMGLQPGDRVLTWAPSSPELAATYFGAMKARLIFVPLDLGMSADAIQAIATKSGARRIVVGSGRGAPQPHDAGLDELPCATVEALAADGDADLPSGWHDLVLGWDRPQASDVFELIFTSGTTGSPKGVMMAHANLLASIRSFHKIIPPLEHRLVSVMPLSHLLEQSVGLYYCSGVGADTVYVHSRHPRVIFETFQEHRVTTMVVAPQILDLFWRSIEREAEKAGRGRQLRLMRLLARNLPIEWRRRLFRSVHDKLGGQLRLFVSAGSYLPPAIQQAWQDIGVIVLQGYGTTETGTGACQTLEDHGLGTVGRPPEGVEMRIAPDGEVEFRGAMLCKGYWEDPERTAAAFTPDGWFRTGDVGHLDRKGRLILSGRKKDMIALPNGLNVYPEDIENALRDAGLRDTVVLETEPGKIEAIVLAPDVLAAGSRRSVEPDGEAAYQAARDAIDTAVKAANRHLGIHQRVVAWRPWPKDAFPMTHTLKVRRAEVRAWVGQAGGGGAG